MVRPGSSLFILLLLWVSCATPVLNKFVEDEGTGPEMADEGVKVIDSVSVEEPGRSEIKEPPPSPKPEDTRDWLKEAEEAWFINENRAYADYCLDRVDHDNLAGERRDLYRLLCQKIYTRYLAWNHDRFPLTNVSALYLDRDDLWIGTWDGGIGRFSLPLGELTVFRESQESLSVESVYAFMRKGRTLYAAGYGALYQYDMPTSTLENLVPLGPSRINGIARFEDSLFISTLMKGVWYEAGGEVWHVFPLPDGTGMINGLAASERCLFLATAERGLLVYDGIDTYGLDRIHPDFTGRNITSLTVRDDWIIIGSYGEGCWLIDRIEGGVLHYTRKEGFLESDYVLSTAMSEGYAFFGTLGGGVTAFSLDKENRRIQLGLEEGLPSRDISALTVYGNSLIAAGLGGGLAIVEEKLLEKTF